MENVKNEGQCNKLANQAAMYYMYLLWLTKASVNDSVLLECAKINKLK